jgi:hypothetical protein
VKVEQLLVLLLWVDGWGSVLHRTSGSTTGEPLSLVASGLPEAISQFMPGVHQLVPAAMKEVMHSGGLVKWSRSTNPLFIVYGVPNGGSSAVVQGGDGGGSIGW